MPTGNARIATEVAPGTAAAAATLSTKKVFLPAEEVYITRGLAMLTRDDELRASSEALPHVPDLFSPEWRARSRMYPDTLGIMLAAMWGLSATGETGAAHYTVTAGNGVITDPDAAVIPVGAHRHVWEMPFGPAGVTPKTHQLNASYKDQGVFLEARGCATSQLSIDTPGEGGAMLAASGPALYADTVADPGFTPTYESVATRPFMRRGLAVMTWLAGSAQASDFGLALTNPVEAIRTLGVASAYPDLMEKAEDLVLGAGSIAVRQLDPQDLDALKNATEFAIKARWASETVIASGYTHKFWVESPSAQYTSEELDPLKNMRRHGAQFNWRAVRNAASSLKLTLVNNVASYA